VDLIAARADLILHRRRPPIGSQSLHVFQKPPFLLGCATTRHLRPISYAIRARVACDMGRTWRLVAQVLILAPVGWPDARPKEASPTAATFALVGKAAGFESLNEPFLGANVFS
jgi:hypothetical protein